MPGVHGFAACILRNERENVMPLHQLLVRVLATAAGFFAGAVARARIVFILRERRRERGELREMLRAVEREIARQENP